MFNELLMHKEAEVKAIEKVNHSIRLTHTSTKGIGKTSYYEYYLEFDGDI